MQSILSVRQLANKFADEAASDPNGFFKSPLKPVKGVSIIPIHRYYNPGSRKHGKTCVILGRERGGSYAGKFNFIGGRIDGHADNPWITLFEETVEELGIELNYEDFKKSVIGYCFINFPRTVRSPSGVKRTLVFFVHILGISTAAYDTMYALRKMQFCPWQFVEMDVLAHMPINELRSRSDLSDFVLENIAELEKRAKSLPNWGIHVSYFKAKSTIGNILPML